MAGYVPPYTLGKTPTLYIGTRPEGAPIHTAVDSLDVTPTNQASALSSADPVLPATFQPWTAAAVPVPYCTTCCSTEVTVRAFCTETARSTLGLFRYRTVPSLSSIRSMKYGSWCSPSLASVA